MDKSISVFIFYAREDRQLFGALGTHLSVLKGQKMVDTWYEQEIVAGTNLYDEIKVHLTHTSQIILLLISPDFMKSKYDQLQRVLEQDNAENIHVIPILLRPTDLQHTTFQEFRPLPDNGQPVTTWRDRDKAFLNIVTAVRAIIEQEYGAPASSERNTGKQTFVWPSNIPDDRYYPLPKREQNLQEYIFSLLDQGKERILVLSGFGGMGKTSLGVELARRMFKSGQFVGIIGDSAKQERLIGGAIISLPGATLDLSEFLNSIADQMNVAGIRALEENKKVNALASYLQQHPHLIIADNLETFEDLEKTVDSLNRLLRGGESRVIITSRKDVKYDAVLLRKLQGLDLEDSLFFLREEAERTNNHHLRTLQEAPLAEIHAITDGAPLAMKLIASQLNFFELEDILRRLRQVQGQERLLYRFIFQQSWEQLSFVAKKVLISIGRTVSTTISWQDLVTTYFTDDTNELQDAIRQLIMYSLIDISYGENLRYGLHPLTRHFVASTLPEIWGDRNAR